MESNPEKTAWVKKRETKKAGIDARIRLLIFGSAVVLIITNRGLIFPAVLFALSASICFYMKIPAKKLAHRFSEPLFIAGVLFLIKAISGGGPVRAAFDLLGWKIHFYENGMHEGLVLSFRVMAAVSALSVFTLSTDFSDIISGLGWFRVPRQIIEITFLADRYIKVFLSEAQTIYHSQKNRLGYAGVSRSLKSFGILAGSLTIKTFDQAQATSLAMEQRGYTGKFLPGDPERMARPPRKREFLLAGLIMSFMVLMWIKLQ